MRSSYRVQLVMFLAAGAVAVGAAYRLQTAADRWYTPALEVVGLLAAIVFLWLGIRWTFSRLSDLYGD